MNRTLVYFFLFYTILGFGQKAIAQNLTETEALKKAKINFFKTIDWRYSKLDSCINLSNEIEVLEKKFNSSAIKAYKKGCLAIYYLEKYNLLEAEKNALISERYFKENNLLQETSLLQSILGRIYQNKSDYVKASAYYFASNEIAEKIEYDYVKILNDKNLAFVFLDQKDFKKAYSYVAIANKLALKSNNTIELGFTEGILAEIYRSDEKLKEADYHFKKAFNYFNSVHSEFGKAWTLTNWSIVFGKDLEKSQKMQVEAQKIWNKIAPNNVMSIANQYNIGYNFLDLYDKGNDLKHIKNFNVSNEQLLDSCFFYINKCLNLAKAENNLQWQMYCYGTLNVIYYEQKEFGKYVRCNNFYHDLKDSIYSQENKNKIAALEVSKKMELKNKEIELNRVTIENKEKQKWYLIAGLFLLGTIGCLLLYQNQNRKKTNQKLQLLNAELDEANKIKARFFSILNHDLRSPVANLLHFLHLQKDNPELLDEESKKRIETKTISGAENLLASMEDILLWSKGQMENFKPQPKPISITSIFNDTKAHFSSEEKIQFQFENPNNISLITDENYLKTIIRNLTGNAVKALAYVQNPSIVWSAFQENNTIIIAISDNGSGATTDQFKALYDEKEVVGIKTGLGLHLIRDLAKAIDCEIVVDSKINSGTTITLSFK